ncbi:UNVERIFIED_CONTAM: hypothetical protein Sindi_2688300 [Sesamum indicum]
MAKSKKARQQAKIFAADQSPTADDSIKTAVTKSAGQQPSATTTAGKVSSSAFNEFISDMEVSPSLITKNVKANATDNRSEGKLLVTENASKKTVSFAGLFSTNRKLTAENKLTKFAMDDGPLTLGSDDLLDVGTNLGFCLVGYITGKFLGLKAIRALSQSWGASF